MKKRFSAILYLLGFICFTLFYNEIRPFHVETVFEAVFVTLLIGGSVLGLTKLLRYYKRENLFWLFILLVFILKLAQGYFDPEAADRLHGLNYGYYVFSVFIVTFYYIRK